MRQNNISMSDDSFAAPQDFKAKVKKRFNLGDEQADFLIFSSWRKFKLILAKDSELRKKLRLHLEELK